MSTFLPRLARSVLACSLVLFTTSSIAAFTIQRNKLTVTAGQSGSGNVSNDIGVTGASPATGGTAGTGRLGNRLKVKDSAGQSSQIVATNNNETQQETTAAPAHLALTATPSSLALAVGQHQSVAIANAVGRLGIAVANSKYVSVVLSGTTLTVTGKAVGSTQVTVHDQRAPIVTIKVAVTKVAPPPPTIVGDFKLLAWNNLGMHCMDSDYSVFSILPPYNVLHAQLINTGTNSLVTSGVTVTFEAMADPSGSVNSISTNKTNFWQYAQPLYGANLPAGVGLTGFGTASYTPQALVLDAPYSQFAAEGIPITPYDDSMQKNTYPMVKVVAKDTAGHQLAEAHVVLPVSDEMTCIACHGSNSGPAAKPAAGWVNDANSDRDYRRNILRLHDEKQLGDSMFASALSTKGYKAAGLLATADAGTPILCAACHSTNALAGTGVSGIKPMTEAMHARHATVNDPKSGLALDNINSRDSCYMCHPGSQTKCLRGVMGNAVRADGSMAIQCQSCHGRMTAVGRTGRAGWLEEPNCQACHHDGVRDLAAVDNSGTLKTTSDVRFATNPNVPATGVSLYRFSKGHGNLQCEACHGATHAEYPSSHPNDNILATETQGHDGTIAECIACHKVVPMTTNGGPHGMHTTGATWVSSHGNSAEGHTQTCAYCHGTDFRGSVLSQVKVAKTLNKRSYVPGQAVGCYDCHNGPNGG